MSDYAIVHRTDGPDVIIWADGTTMPAIAGAADDLPGLKTTLQQAFDALINDKGAAYNNETELRVVKQLIALIRQKATSNGVTGL